MSGLEFFQTVMGRAFYEVTMPGLIRQLELLNKNLSKLTEEKKDSRVEEVATAIMDIAERCHSHSNDTRISKQDSDFLDEVANDLRYHVMKLKK